VASGRGVIASVHVEMYEDNMFCGHAGTGSDHGAVPAADWHAESEAVQRATCEQCLLRIFMLGDSATIALARMGRKIEVIDAPTEIEPS
jgi:hypothetical protein